MLNILFWLVDSILSLVQMLVIISFVVNLLLYFELLNRRNHVVSKIEDTLNRLTEPMFRAVRRFVPPINGIDLSPLVLMFAIELLRRLLALLVFQAAAI